MVSREKIPYNSDIIPNGNHGIQEENFGESDDPTASLLSTSSSCRPIVKPKDSFKAVYLIIGFMSMGSLLPWNMFITASGYYRAKFKSVNGTTNSTEFQETFENFFSVSANVSNILMLFCNAALKHLVTLNMRMYSSMVVILVMFVFTSALVLVPTDSWQSLFFGITIISVVIISLFGGLLQGTLLGLAGILPSEYMQSAMSGQAVAGIFASLASILSIAASSDVMDSAFGYFLSAVAVMVLSLMLYVILHKLPFFNFYYLKTKDEELTDGSINQSLSSSISIVNSKTKPPFLLIFKKIQLMAILIITVFAVTLSCFPAIASRVSSMNQRSTWGAKYFTPVACFLLFNVCDCIGRTLTSLFQWPGESGILLSLFVILRIAFIPLFMLCNVTPRHHTHLVFDQDVYFIVFMLVFGISNGYLGTLCMIYGPNKVDEEHKETAGAMMALFLAVGLGLGGALSFAVAAAI